MKARQAHQDEAASFDTDSKAIRIDNCASYCISNDKKDFITPLKRVNKKLKGLGGTLTEIYSGTIKWSIEDDTGVPHDIVIPHGLYVKDSPSKLLSPQHWAQTAQDFKPLPRGTWCATYHDSIQLHWAQRQHTKTHGQARLLSKKLAKCQVPTCTSCLYGKATRRPWRTKPKGGQQGGKLRTASEPGQCISIDQLESSTPGLIAQIKGWLTKKRYKVATIFVDHFSGLSYIHLQKSTNADETLEAKLAFERYASKFKVQVKSYQADNGRFAENKFMAAVKEAGQTITFCGVNAHFQNAVAERRIRTLQDQARTMLIHAQHRWPKAIDAHLWPYALRVANEIHNSTPTIGRVDHKSPFELFARSEVTPNLNHFQPFGCPVFVLDNKMQSGQKLPKWEVRARMESTLAYPCSMPAVWLLFSTSRLAMSLPSFMSHLIPSLRQSGSHWATCHLHQNGRSFVDSRPHHLPGFKASSNQLKLKVCNVMSPSWNLIWNLENRSMRERLKHLKHHFQFLRENKEELPVQFRRSPRLNKIPGAASTKVSDEPSSKAGSKVFDVWHNFEAKLEDKLPYYVAFEAIKEWMDIEESSIPCWLSPLRRSRHDVLP
ncbi:hypothetical protein MHU86_13425 [Fragilaria crotonensis]|nr:hypothetical protein MHU86_13425 [Fragilaria crotonensis]